MTHESHDGKKLASPDLHEKDSNHGLHQRFEIKRSSNSKELLPAVSTYDLWGLCHFQHRMRSVSGPYASQPHHTNVASPDPSKPLSICESCIHVRPIAYSLLHGLIPNPILLDRTKELAGTSEICSVSYDGDHILRLFESFKQQSARVLLFLKSVARLKFYVQTASDPAPQLLYSAAAKSDKVSCLRLRNSQKLTPILLVMVSRNAEAWTCLPCRGLSSRSRTFLGSLDLLIQSVYASGCAHCHRQSYQWPSKGSSCKSAALQVREQHLAGHLIKDMACSIHSVEAFWSKQLKAHHKI